MIVALPGLFSYLFFLTLYWNIMHSTFCLVFVFYVIYRLFLHRMKIQPAHDKPAKWHVHPAKTQIRMDIRPIR